MTNPFAKIKQFSSEMISELKKSSWPDRHSLRQSTITVVIAMFLLGSYVSIVDFSLFNAIKFIGLAAR
jgi:preprotein translocase SecE subunit